jgi:hypothetical protein
MNRCLELKGYGELGVENHPLLHTILEVRRAFYKNSVHTSTSVRTFLIFCIIVGRLE